MQKFPYQSLHCLLGQSDTGNHPDTVYLYTLFKYYARNIKNVLESPNEK